MADDEGQEEDGPLFAWLPPEDRLWRHPSEVSADPNQPTRPFPSGRGGWPANHLWSVAVAAGLVGALVASALFVATGTLYPHSTTRVIEQPVTPTSLLTNKTTSSGADGATWPQVAKMLAPSVVAVSSSVAGAGEQTGSGVIVLGGGSKTYVVTSSDLLQSGGALRVQLNDGRTVTAKLAGSDQVTGLSVLSIPVTHQNLPVWGSVAALSEAEPVLAIGANTSSGSNYTQGTVSSLDQTVADQNDTTLVGMLAITGSQASPTTDGGAVVDQAGEVIGIETNAASTGSDQSMAYAVPVDVAYRVAIEIVTHRPITHPWLGVESSVDGGGGALVGPVYPGSPAARIGLRPDDIITDIAGQRVTSSGMVTSVITAYPVGRRVAIDFRQGKQTFHRVAVIGNQPSLPAS